MSLRSQNTTPKFAATETDDMPLPEVAMSQELITDCFGDLPVASFVVGSIANGEATSHSDVDLLVCLPESAEPRSLARFQSGYLAMHRVLGRKPDREYPGEVVDIARLTRALDAASAHLPTRNITSSTVYDGIVWAGMLGGRRINLEVPDPLIDILIQRAEGILEKWARALGCYRIGSHVELDKLLAREIVYEN